MNNIQNIFILNEKKFYCPVEFTLDVIGGKYKILILNALRSGILRYSELQKRIPNATSKMLTQQLRELEKDGMIHRKVYPVVPPKVEYSLTEKANSLLPTIHLMAEWGMQFLSVENVQ